MGFCLTWKTPGGPEGGLVWTPTFVAVLGGFGPGLQSGTVSNDIRAAVMKIAAKNDPTPADRGPLHTWGGEGGIGVTAPRLLPSGITPNATKLTALSLFACQKSKPQWKNSPPMH